MRLLFIGFGNVAKEMARIFTHRELYPKLRLAPETVGIFTARHGGVEDAKGLDLAAVLDLEKRIAGLSKPITLLRDPRANYALVPTANLAKQYRKLQLQDFLKAEIKRFVVWPQTHTD